MSMRNYVIIQKHSDPFNNVYIIKFGEKKRKLGMSNVSIVSSLAGVDKSAW